MTHSSSMVIGSCWNK